MLVTQLQLYMTLLCNYSLLLFQTDPSSIIIDQSTKYYVQMHPSLLFNTEEGGGLFKLEL